MQTVRVVGVRVVSVRVEDVVSGVGEGGVVVGVIRMVSVVRVVMKGRCGIAICCLICSQTNASPVTWRRIPSLYS